MEIESSVSLLSSEASTRLEPGQENSSEKERNGSASPPAGATRLASLTGLLMSQKPLSSSSSSPSKCNNNSTSSDTPSTAVSSPPATSETDQGSGGGPPSLIRAVRFDEDNSTDLHLRRAGSFGVLHRRPGPSPSSSSAAGSGTKAPSAAISDSDLRRFVFHHPRAKRMVSGLRVRAFSRQAFVSSFTVGLALGSVVAIVLKIINDLALRMLYN